MPADEYEVCKAREAGDLLRLPMRYRVIDLFSGAGGMSLGFSKKFGHAFESVFANDINEYAAATYTHNFGSHCFTGDIVELLKTEPKRIPRADVVIGGPPCQGFSLLNKKRKGDVRKQLWRPFMEVVEISNASVFVMENVPQLLGTREHDEILEVAAQQGFRLAHARLCAADYGVPQTRWRAFIVGSKYADPAFLFPPKKTHKDPRTEGARRMFVDTAEYIADPEPWRTVRDAIGDLPKPVGTQIRKEVGPLDLHFGRTPTPLSLSRYKAIPKEGMNRFDLQERAPELTPQCWIRKKSGGTDLFGRLWWNRPAVTMRTEFYKPEKGRYLHPKQHRPMTHREAARFQSFPDDFVFLGTKIEVARQIGNAVPPQLAARIADCVYAILQRDNR